MSADLSGLYKTTVIFWTSHPPGGMPVARLAQKATDGDAYCSGQPTVLVPCPDADPDPPGAEFVHEDTVAIRLLCDRCFEAVTGEEAQCQPGCRHDRLDDDGACLWPEGPAECQWCGHADRLTPVPGAHEGFARLPTVGERGDCTWWLNWAGESKGPYQSPDEAWADWHESAD